ncbi:cytochrome P450 family protein [Streptomyces sp. bgisy100]|uniref:cytochrome P450 family protein n=1 Tax=Streptomyces sp. bgisy100 TaxID=3413783 RepID=UPI003D74D773
MTRPSPPATDGPSLFDEALLTDPHAGYARLRAAGPVHRTTTPDGADVWLVTRFDDVQAALVDPRLSLNKGNALSVGSHGPSMPPELDAHLLNLDPPDHTRLRRLVSRAFTPRRVEGLRSRVGAVTEELLDGFGGTGADLMAGLALPLPMAVICELLGVPQEARPDFRTWTNTLRSPEPDSALDSREAMGRMHGYLTGLIAEKRARPGDDLVSAMIGARDDHDRLTEPELLALTFLILFAGYDNAVNLIGNTALALLTHEEQRERLLQGRISVQDVLRETLRWESPSLLASRRFPLEDLTIGGVTIRAGERIWLSLASANRDEARFEEPDSFDPARGGTHLDFGHGIHYCLGAPLAQLEGEVAITALLRRYPTLRLAVAPAELRWRRSFRNRGLAELPVGW